MVIVSKSRRLVVHLAPVMLSFAVAASAVVITYRRPHLWQTLVDCVLSSVLLAVGLGLQRVVRRKGDELEVWTVLGRRRVKAKRVFLGVTAAGTRNGLSIDIKIFLGKSMHPWEPSILVASDPTPPLAVAQRIAEVLDMPEPQLDSGLFRRLP